MSSRLKQLVRIADEKAHAIVSPMRRNSDKAALEAYRKAVFDWKHTYVDWIEENESVARDEGDNAEKNSNDEKIRLTGFLEKNGEWIVYCTENGYLSTGMTEYLSDFLSENSSDNSTVSVLYGDEDYLWEDGGKGMRMCPFFKPDYSQETLLSFSYFGELIIIKRTIADRICGVFGDENSDTAPMCRKSIKGSGAVRYADALTLYEISLKAAELVGREGVGHIGHILYHRSAASLCGCNVFAETKQSSVRSNEDVAEQNKNNTQLSGALFYEKYDRAERILTDFLEDDENIGRVLAGAGNDGIRLREEALRRRGLRGKLVKAKEGDLYHILYECDEKVSVIILSKDNPELLEKCVSGIRQNTVYTDYEIIVVDNGSNEENRRKCELLAEKYEFSYYHHPMEFNFSALCNYGVGKSSGNLILLMNDDVEVVDGEYMSLMAGLAARDGIGAVGARLRYGDGISIQHVGVTGLGIGPSHQLQKKSDNRNYYFGRNRADYEMIGVTAACLMVKRKAYEAVGGLDEGLKVAYNDVDFCMKLVEAGYINVQCNGAVLLHHESLTRGFDGDSDAKWNRLLAEKEGLYSRHPQYRSNDPYHSPSLIDNSSEYMCSHKNIFQDFEWRSSVTEVSEASEISELTGSGFGFRVTMDHSTLQRRFNPGDEDFLWIDGWVYVPGADQTYIKKQILLDGGNGTIYKVDTKDVYRPDVEELLPAAKNIAMAGFLARIVPESVPKGSYLVGIALEGGGRRSCMWTKNVLERR